MLQRNQNLKHIYIYTMRNSLPAKEAEYLQTDYKFLLLY